MLILAKAQAKDPAGGYARTFLTQMEQVLGTCSDRGIKIVANAGGLNPAGLAVRLRELADRLGITVRIAHIEGDDLRGNLSAITPAVGEVKPVSANAYLGGVGGYRRSAGCGRRRRRHRTGDRRLAGRRPGRLVARVGAHRLGPARRCRRGRPRHRMRTTGHGRQLRLPRRDHRPSLPGLPDRGGGGRRLVGDHQARRHRGGLVSVGTVTAQLLYEIAEPAYLGPDVVTHFDTISLAQQAEHRVAITGVTGSPPPETLKVALNEVGGATGTP